MKLGTSIIKIHCNKLDWNNIINKFDNILPTFLLLLISIFNVFGFILHKYLSNVLCKLDVNIIPLFIL